MGTFEIPLIVPELKQSPVKVSSVILGTQLQPVDARKTSSPLVRDGIELVPNLTSSGATRSCTSTTKCTTRRVRMA